MDTRKLRYTDISSRERKIQPTYLFMMHCLLYSRVQTGVLSNQDCHDEDVNVYLAQLLNSFINPQYVDRVKHFLSKYDTEVFQRLATSTDARLKYTIYKTNADFLLVSIGIFDNPSAILGKPKRKTEQSEEEKPTTTLRIHSVNRFIERILQCPRFLRNSLWALTGTQEYSPT
jgi:hypothetical protein